MKLFFRLFLFTVFALWFTSQLFPALVIYGSWQSLLFAGFVLTILKLLIQPLLKIILLPISFLTFGLLSWIVHVLVFYLLTVFVPEVQIHAWSFAGVSWLGFVIPPMQCSYTASLVIASLLVALLSNILDGMTHD